MRGKERKKRVGGNEEEVEERRVREKMEVVDRRVGVAVDFAACSKEALRWAVENIIRDGDHLILLTVLLEGHYEEGEMQLWEATGSPLIPLSEFCDPILTKKYGVKPDAEMLDIASCVARQKDIVVLMKVYWGDAQEKICEAIENIPLSCLVIRNRGLSKIKRSGVEGIREDRRNRTGFPANDNKTSSSSSPPRLPRRLRRSLLEPKSPCTVEEIEAKLKEADLCRQILNSFKVREHGRKESEIHVLHGF